MFFKRGNISLQKMLFLLGYLGIGVMILLVSITIFENTSDGTAESKIAADLALSIKSLSIFEGDVFIMYSPSLETYSVDIVPFDDLRASGFRQKGVDIRVSGPSGTASSKAILPNFIELEGVSWDGKTSLPLQKKGNLISFEELSADELRGLCNKLPGRLDGAVSVQEAQDDQGQLSDVERGLEGRLSNLGFSEGRADLNIKVTFRDTNEGRIYHGRGVSEKVACFLDVTFNSLVQSGSSKFDNVSRSLHQDDSLVVLELPNRQSFSRSSALKGDVITAIVSAIEEVKDE